jgi:hypothetical protein
MIEKKVVFRFKGDRKYIQGPDIFNSIYNGHKQYSNIVFTIHEFIVNPACIIIESKDRSEIEKNEDIKVRYYYMDKGQKHFGCVLEDLAVETKQEFYEYDEQSIIDKCQIDGSKLILKESSGFTFIESVVAMNKYLHNCIYPELDGKWVFTRIDLPEFVNYDKNIHIEILHNMNNKLTKSAIQINEEVIGYIYFSLVNA